MSLKPLALLLSSAAMLSACASAPQGEPMTWGYAAAAGPEGPKLAFGVDETDYLAVMFSCDPMTGSVKFDIPIGEGANVSAVKLHSGGLARRYEPFVSAEADGVEAGHYQTDRTDPVLRTFAKSGRLSLNVHGGFVSHDVKTLSERDAVAHFAKACGLS